MLSQLLTARRRYSTVLGYGRVLGHLRESLGVVGRIDLPVQEWTVEVVGGSKHVDLWRSVGGRVVDDTEAIVRGRREVVPQPFLMVLGRDAAVVADDGVRGLLQLVHVVGGHAGEIGAEGSRIGEQPLVVTRAQLRVVKGPLRPALAATAAAGEALGAAAEDDEEDKDANDDDDSRGDTAPVALDAV